MILLWVDTLIPLGSDSQGLCLTSKCLFFLFDQLLLQFAINIHLRLVHTVLTAKGTQTVHSLIGKDCCFDLPQCSAVPLQGDFGTGQHTPKLDDPLWTDKVAHGSGNNSKGQDKEKIMQCTQLYYIRVL